MKKVLAVAFCLVLMFSVLAIGASAAGTFGTYEQKVITELSAKETYKMNGKDVTFKIPTNYVNQAKAFFVSTQGDITKAQYEEIMSFVNAGKKLVKDTALSDNSYFKNGQVNIADMPQAIRSAVLKCGQDACKVVGLNLIFDGKHVVITDAEGAIRFDDAPIVKTTGGDTGLALSLVVLMSFVLVVGGCFVAAKKAKLFKNV